MRGRSRQKQSESRPGQHHQTQVKTPSLAAARARAGIRRRTRIVMSKAPTRSRQTRMERMSPLSVHVRVLFVHSLLYRSMWNSRLCSTKREKIIQPAPRMHCPSTRTNELGISLTARVIVLLGRSDFTRGRRTTPRPIPVPAPIPMLACIPISVYLCLSLSLSAHALCSADSHLDRQSGLKFSIACLSSRNRAELHFSPSKSFLEYV